MTIGRVRFVNNIVLEKDLLDTIFESKHLKDRMAKLEQDFQEKFDSFSNLIDTLETNLQSQLDRIDPENLSGRLSLLEEQDLIRTYKEKLGEIDEGVKASEEAANWLDSHRADLISYAGQHIFGENTAQLKKFRGVFVNSESITHRPRTQK